MFLLGCFHPPPPQVTLKSRYIAPVGMGPDEDFSRWALALCFLHQSIDAALNATTITFGAAISACEAGDQWSRDTWKTCRFCNINNRRSQMQA